MNYIQKGQCISSCIIHSISLSSLGEDDLHDILTEVGLVDGDWKAIGRGLKIDPGRLKRIQADNCGNAKECLSEVLTCWLKGNYNVKRFGEPTWQAVVKVVADPAGGDNHARALSIAKKHQGNTCTYLTMCLCR